MASLNLVPNVSVMLTQAGIFTATLFVVKRTMLDPFLKVKKKRLHYTVGYKTKAKNLLESNEKIISELNMKMSEASSELSKVREEYKARSLKEKNKIIEDAEKEVKAIIDEAKKQIDNEIASEKEKIPVIAQKLSTEMFDQIVK